MNGRSFTKKSTSCYPRPPCDFPCVKACSTKFKKLTREKIQLNFWEKDFIQRRDFMKNSKNQFYYSTRCLLRMLTIHRCVKNLSQHPGVKTGQLITEFAKGAIANPMGLAKDQREKMGEKHQRKKMEHVNSLHPHISHYDREACSPIANIWTRAQR